MFKSKILFSFLMAQSLIACNQPKSAGFALKDDPSPRPAQNGLASFQADGISCKSAFAVAGMYLNEMDESLNCEITLSMHALNEQANAKFKVREHKSDLEVVARATQARGQNKSGFDLQVKSLGSDYPSAFSDVVICYDQKVPSVKQQKQVVLKRRSSPGQDVCKTGTVFATLKKADIDAHGNPILGVSDSNGNPVLGETP
jgi:hypothetical protein